MLFSDMDFIVNCPFNSFAILRWPFYNPLH